MFCIRKLRGADVCSGKTAQTSKSSPPLMARNVEAVEACFLSSLCVVPSVAPSPGASPQAAGLDLRSVGAAAQPKRRKRERRALGARPAVSPRFARVLISSVKKAACSEVRHRAVAQSENKKTTEKTTTQKNRDS